MVTEIVRSDKTILIVDYTNRTESQMMQIITSLKEKIMEKSKPVLILSIFNDKSYITQGFMRTVERESAAVINLVDKQAVVGLNSTKKLILKGYNFLFKRNIQNFETKEEALKFLLDETTTDKDFRWRI